MSEEELEIEFRDAPEPEPVYATDREGLVVVASAALRDMDEHVAEDTTVEHGGVMVGRVDAATGATVVTGAIRAIGSVSDVASLTFTHETWDHVNAVLEADHPNERMVGWYHSHPHFGIFLSEHDQFIHRNFFGQVWQIAYVRDPLLDERGFFSWVGDQIVEVGTWEEIPYGEESGAQPDAPPIGGGSAPPAADSGVEAPDPRPTDALPASADGVEPRRPRRTGLAVVAVVVIGVVLALVAVFALGGGDDDTLVIELRQGGDPGGLPGVELQVGTVELIEGDAGTTQLSVSPGTATNGGEPIEVVATPIGTGLWQLVALVPEDARPGDYQGTVAAIDCGDSADDACVASAGPRSEAVTVTFTVDELEPPAAPDTTAAVDGDTEGTPDP